MASTLVHSQKTFPSFKLLSLVLCCVASQGVQRKHTSIGVSNTPLSLYKCICIHYASNCRTGRYRPSIHTNHFRFIFILDEIYLLHV
jgi:hypothetical protein